MKLLIKLCPLAEGSTSLELDGNMYVGGLGPPFSEIPIPAGLWTAVLQQGFVGCFKDLVMNNEAVDVASFAREQDSGKLTTVVLLYIQPFSFIHLLFLFHINILNFPQCFLLILRI